MLLTLQNGTKVPVKLHHGIYVFNSGPNYESKGAVKTLRNLAPGTVGMSSVPEALAARMLGLHVYGLSIITNLAAGMENKTLAHEEVSEIGKMMSHPV